MYRADKLCAAVGGGGGNDAKRFSMSEIEAIMAEMEELTSNERDRIRTEEEDGSG
jgi:hypothetical protein